MAISASWSPPDIEATGTPRRCLSACVHDPEFGIPDILSGGVAHPARPADTDIVKTARFTIPPLFNKSTRRQHYVVHYIAQVLGGASHTIIFDNRRWPSVAFAVLWQWR